ncbi:MAG: hypothetical protein HY037_04310 [Nitrospirae bacterium]|nr:hypothetical protein [Candidatus Troglogloeales bacterium]
MLLVHWATYFRSGSKEFVFLISIDYIGEDPAAIGVPTFARQSAVGTPTARVGAFGATGWSAAC